MNMNTSMSGGSSHNTTATASSNSDKGTLFGSAAAMDVGVGPGNSSHANLSITDSSHRGHQPMLWGTGSSNFSFMAGGPGGGAGGSSYGGHHVRHKPPFTPKLGGSGRKIIGGSRTPIQQVSLSAYLMAVYLAFSLQRYTAVECKILPGMGIEPTPLRIRSYWCSNH